MSFESKNYLYLAQELAGKTPINPSNEEARLRSAISRAYYAAFCSARDYLESKTPLVIPRAISVHHFIKQQFLDSRDGKHKRIGRYLELLHDNRKLADYGDEIKGLSKVADLVLQRADDVIKWIDELN